MIRYISRELTGPGPTVVENQKEKKRLQGQGQQREWWGGGVRRAGVYRDTTVPRPLPQLDTAVVIL